MRDALRERARETPDRVAVVMADGSGSLTFAELDRRADRMAALYQQIGLLPGTTVALLHDNDTQILGWWWGARRAGLYYAPLGTKLTATELAYIVRDCAAKVVIATAGLGTLAADAAALVHGVQVLVAGGTLDERLVALGRADPAPADIVGRELIYSSGTTGKPRGIRRALAPTTRALDLPALERRMRAVFRIDADTVYLSVSPLYHATGRFLNRVIEAGGTAIVAPKFEAESALAAIQRHRVTHTQWVPTMFTRLLALPAAVRNAHDLSSHRVALHAAAPCPIPVKRAMIGWWGPIVDEYYGGTENAGVTFISAADWLNRPGSVGRSITGAIHILDEDGSERERAAGQIGLVHFEGGLPFDYMNAHGGEATRTGEGYATYGDLGHVDADGYLYISDRRSDLIISGGVNVYPKEVELVLESHPAVAEVAVIGVPDVEFGQRVWAVIRPEGTISPDLAAALDGFCRSQLSRIKCPRGFDFVDEFPRNDNGKLLKRVLRARYMTGA